MDDSSWVGLREPHERLRWARKRAGFETMRAAAEALGFENENTYSAYEREPGASKHTPLDHQRAIQFARKFKVPWEWLLVGEGSPFQERLTPAQERALAAMRGASEEDQERAAAAIEGFLKSAGRG